MQPIDLDNLARVAQRKERYLAMYREERCAECGAEIAYFDSTNFEGSDVITQRFYCVGGHEFCAVFVLADVLCNPEAEEKT